MIVLTVVWWLLVLGGLVPATWFLWRFRPKWPPRSPSVIVNGLVWVIWLTYIRSVLVIAARGWKLNFPDVAGTAIGLTIGGAVDGLLILMLVRFLQYRKQVNGHRDEHEEGSGG